MRMKNEQTQKNRLISIEKFMKTHRKRPTWEHWTPRMLLLLMMLLICSIIDRTYLFLYIISVARGIMWLSSTQHNTTPHHKDTQYEVVHVKLLFFSLSFSHNQLRSLICCCVLFVGSAHLAAFILLLLKGNCEVHWKYNFMENYVSVSFRLLSFVAFFLRYAQCSLCCCCMVAATAAAIATV